jgi:hypothetical protein
MVLYGFDLGALFVVLFFRVLPLLADQITFTDDRIFSPLVRYRHMVDITLCVARVRNAQVQTHRHALRNGRTRPTLVIPSIVAVVLSSLHDNDLRRYPCTHHDLPMDDLPLIRGHVISQLQGTATVDEFWSDAMKQSPKSAGYLGNGTCSNG